MFLVRAIVFVNLERFRRVSGFPSYFTRCAHTLCGYSAVQFIELPVSNLEFQFGNLSVQLQVWE